MIVDWTQHVQKMHKSHKVSLADEFDRKHAYKQEVVYVRYLIKEGYTYEKIKAEWLQIKNGIAKKIGEDEDELDIQFASIYKLANSKSYKFYDSVKELQPVPIYKAEIEYLNSLDLLKWEKEYWMAILIYYKFAKQTQSKVYYDMTLRNWALDMTSEPPAGARKFVDVWSTLSRDRMKTGRNIVQFYAPRFNDKCSTFVPSFIKSGGEVQMNLSMINKGTIRKIFTKLENRYKICSKCGKKFEITNNNKTDLCPECLKEDVLARKRKEMDTKVKICPICGKEFTVSSKTKREICDDCYKIQRKQAINNNAKKYYQEKNKKNEFYTGIGKGDPPLL